MNLDSVPIWAFFFGTIFLVMLVIEIGYRLGTATQRAAAEEKEAAISGASGTVLGLTAFIMAFTFAIVADRYQDRRGLVRDDANAIRIAYVRADFVPEPDRAESKRLLKDYLDQRLAFANAGIVKKDLIPLLTDTDRIQRRLWRIAVSNAERDMNSDVAALYIESLTDLSSVQTQRLAVGVRARVPLGIWITLYSLMSLGMLTMGYHAGVAASKRSNATWIVAISFAMVITLIAGLDRPDFIPVTQQPLIDLQAFIAADEAG